MVNMQIGLAEKLLRLVDRARFEQADSGALPAGHNGPYFHRETSIRSTSHWLINFCVALKWTGEDKYRVSAVKAAHFLLSELQRRPRGNPKQRNHNGRDSCNGVIGAAWLLEALHMAWVELELDEARDAAVGLALRHPQDDKSALWHRIECDGRVLSVDQTFNHQLWFAGSIARFRAESPVLDSGVVAFMNRLSEFIRPAASGFIPHRIELGWIDRVFREGTLAYKAYSIGKAMRTQRWPTDLVARDYGYHAFNLLGFVQLHLSMSSHVFWQNSEWLILLDNATEIYSEEVFLERNKYAYPYNPTGFEMAAFAYAFGQGKSIISEWLTAQWLRSTDDNRVEYGALADDPVTSRARICEALSYIPVNLIDS
jgi:hypothetical protein